MSEQVVIQPNTQQWLAWRDYLHAKGQAELVARMDKVSAAGQAMRVVREYPTEESRQKAEAAAQSPRKASTPLSEGAKWLGLYGSAEEPLIDADSPLAKCGMRPSDKLIAVTTRPATPPPIDTRWPARDFLRDCPALRVGQHVTVEFQRDTETKVAIAISYGALRGKPDVLREEDCIPFLRAHPSTKKSLIRWWMSRHPELGEDVAAAALRDMNSRELQNATLMMDNEAMRPGGGQHQVEYRPDRELWKVR
jgi:hypothetical protein